jgi:tRNA(His) 5'-end guanylyltransferase
MSDKNDSLGDRMKAYEDLARFKLMPRMPAIVRVDGHTFHSMVKRWNCVKPFDPELMNAMHQTALALCEAIQGAVFAYTQSDEISVGFIDYQNRDSSAWFDKTVQKMATIAASVATKAFNFHYMMRGNVDVSCVQLKDMAEFDARVWVLPPAEVVNYFIWRQQDATRNSISMAARAVMSHKECNGLNCNQLQEAMFQKTHFNWNSYPVACKRGVCLYRKQTVGEHDGQPVVRNPWFIDTECPVFTQDRAYVDQRFAVPEEPKS